MHGVSRVVWRGEEEERWYGVGGSECKVNEIAAAGPRGTTTGVLVNQRGSLYIHEAKASGAGHSRICAGESHKSASHVGRVASIKKSDGHVASGYTGLLFDDGILTRACCFMMWQPPNL